MSTRPPVPKSATPAQVLCGWTSKSNSADINWIEFWANTRPRRTDMTAEAESKRSARRAIEDRLFSQQQREVWEQGGFTTLPPDARRQCYSSRHLLATSRKK